MRHYTDVEKVEYVMEDNCLLRVTKRSDGVVATDMAAYFGTSGADLYYPTVSRNGHSSLHLKGERSPTFEALVLERVKAIGADLLCKVALEWSDADEPTGYEAVSRATFEDGRVESAQSQFRIVRRDDGRLSVFEHGSIDLGSYATLDEAKAFVHRQACRMALSVLNRRIRESQ